MRLTAADVTSHSPEYPSAILYLAHLRECHTHIQRKQLVPRTLMFLQGLADIFHLLQDRSWPNYNYNEFLCEYLVGK